MSQRPGELYSYIANGQDEDHGGAGEAIERDAIQIAGFDEGDALPELADVMGSSEAAESVAQSEMTTSAFEGAISELEDVGAMSAVVSQKPKLARKRAGCAAVAVKMLTCCAPSRDIGALRLQERGSVNGCYRKPMRKR